MVTCKKLNKKRTGIGLLGLGTVGYGVFKLVSRFENLEIVKIAVKNPQKHRNIKVDSKDIITNDVDEIIANHDVKIVAEMMGGDIFPYQVIKKAIQAKKHVVTANKVVIAKYGPELFELASANGVNLLFEAAVGGGIPLILPLKTSLAANNIEQIAGILNGTTNYILTQMEQNCMDFDVALKEAQQKGFAEPDPSADIKGFDAACKISILASAAYQKYWEYEDIYTEGIENIAPIDIEMAKTLGFAIRLIAMAKPSSCGAVDIRVHPMLVPFSHPLSKIIAENNALWIKGDAVGDVMFYGKGAGEMPTASAVTGDIMLIANALQKGEKAIAGVDFSVKAMGELFPVEDTINSYYLRIETDDKPGVIGQLGKSCGDHLVSLDSIMQKGANTETETANIVLLTHLVSESSMQAALKEIKLQPETRHIHTVMRVFQQ